jgi:hypothetical protein
MVHKTVIISLYNTNFKIYQNDKGAKSKNIPKSNALSESREHSIEKYFLLVCKGLNRMYIKQIYFKIIQYRTINL